MTQTEDWADATERALLDAALDLAPMHGWTPRLIEATGTVVGLSRAETSLLMPRGPADLAALLSKRHDHAALTALSAIDPKTLKIRARIRAAVEARLNAAAADEASVRRWAGFLALPTHIPLAMSLLWESADHLWRWAGDTATDENHYSKRAILSGILVSALAIRLQSGQAQSMKFVDARIENVMAFETWKATLKPQDLLRDVAVALSRLRYR